MDNFLLVFIIILLYILFLFVIQYIGIGSKKRSSNSNNCCPDCKGTLKRVKRFFSNSNNCCPDCGGTLNRVKRFFKDKIIYYLTLVMFDWRRYNCDKCGWEGLRWSKQYRLKNN